MIKLTMTTFYIYSGLCFVIAIILFLSYNSGSGGPLNSAKKRLLYLGAFLFFCGCIYFLTKAYYLNDNIKNEKIAKELIEEYNDLEKMINISLNNPNLIIQEKQQSIKELIQQFIMYPISRAGFTQS